jgi:hypothetical protein
MLGSDNTMSGDLLKAAFGARHKEFDEAMVIGRFLAVCRDKDGRELWSEEFDNLITTVGKNFLLDQALAGSGYTAAEYMGLISSVSFTAVAVGDTMTSHSGWLEAGSSNAPTYSGTRNSCVWSAAAAGVKALSAGLVFTFTGSGTVQGAFIVGGSGASATLMNTGGTLYSAGTLGTPQPVISTNTLTLSYSSTLT